MNSPPSTSALPPNTGTPPSLCDFPCMTPPLPYEGFGIYCDFTAAYCAAPAAAARDIIGIAGIGQLLTAAIETAIAAFIRA